ncbi:LPS export ABC transporter periplasmic protein LptC [Dyadobacter sp. CY343]|uniref:LPS export ABC transporter periplasmic protein LptC n=1 Tax=Dyadobacter sp. CY343 TaxID=2907299 RepID=UPI001F34BCB6|nr:LPS export ABC transporter periplasmic protein LptC [Dyadobacter sp. CY343]MCE7059194.1 LPS export ABC transporter periplasmic protein LptC [Dyadobacter sp. CY343]
MRVLILALYILKGDKILSPFCIVALLAILLSSCEDKKNKVGALYTGPVEVVNDVQVKYSEQGKMKVLMKTPRSLRFQNETQIFPDTVNISFFDSLSTIVTRLRSDSGRYDKSSDIYIVKGNVKVVMSESNQIMYTSELNWSPRTRKIFTDKPVAIRKVGSPEVTNGVGLDAEQDFTSIKFRKGTGVYKLNPSSQ